MLTIFCFFFLSLRRTTKEPLDFIKATVRDFAISITCPLFNVDWLVYFEGEQV